MMRSRIDLLNRVVLGLAGLLMIAGGLLGLLARRGAIPLSTPAQTYEVAADWVLQDGWTVGIGATVAIVVGIGLVLLGLRWALAQFRRRGGHLELLTLQRLAEGRTSVAAAAAAAAAARDLETVPGVTAGAARLVEAGRRPRLLARADMFADADPAAVRAGAEQVYARLARCIGADDINAELRLRPTQRQPARVR